MYYNCDFICISFSSNVLYHLDRESEKRKKEVRFDSPASLRAVGEMDFLQKWKGLTWTPSILGSMMAKPASPSWYSWGRLEQEPLGVTAQRRENVELSTSRWTSGHERSLAVADRRHTIWIFAQHYSLGNKHQAWFVSTSINCIKKAIINSVHRV